MKSNIKMLNYGSMQIQLDSLISTQLWVNFRDKKKLLQTYKWPTRLNLWFNKVNKSHLNWQCTTSMTSPYSSLTLRRKSIPVLSTSISPWIHKKLWKKLQKMSWIMFKPWRWLCFLSKSHKTTTLFSFTKNQQRALI